MAPLVLLFLSFSILYGSQTSLSVAKDNLVGLVGGDVALGTSEKHTAPYQLQDQSEPQFDTIGLSAEDFKKNYWHARVDSSTLNRLAKKDSRSAMFIQGITLYNQQRYSEAIKQLEKSVVYSDAFRELSVLYIYKSYFNLRNYTFAFIVLKNYYPQVKKRHVKNMFIEELARTATFLASQISSEHFWSTDSIAEYMDYLNQKDSLITLLKELDPRRSYNNQILGKEIAHTAYAQGNTDIGDSICFSILRHSKERELKEWAYEKLLVRKERFEDFNDQLRLAETELALRKYESALETFSNLLKRKISKETKISLYRSIAVCNKKLSKYADAIKKYKYTIKYGKPNANDYLNIARCYRSLNNESVSKRWYTLFAKKFPNHEKAIEIKWTEGFEFEQKNELSKALKAYNTFQKKQFDSKRGKWVVFRKGYVEFKRGRYTQAIKYFKQVIKDPELLWPGSAARLFIAKSYLKLNKRNDAREWFVSTIEDYPVGFYGYRARFHLADEKLLADSLIPQISFLELSDEETIEWLRAHQKKRTEIGAEELLEIETLLAVGCWDEAEKRYLALYKRHTGRLDLMYHYAKLFYEYGAIAHSYRITRQMAWRIDRRALMNPPRKLMELLYIRPYFSKVKDKAATESVDPYFVLALMRQESIFDSDIQSGAGAYGLMQIMPYTGKELARREKVKNFSSEMLFNPYLAIQLGVRYIGDLMKKYENEYYVLSNYNAGPTPTKRWQKENGHLETDRFVEEISYWETRDYLKKVMANYWTYQQVWREK